MTLAAAAVGCAFQAHDANAASSADRECLARAMYFESNRSADEGMLAVGTVVANRLKSGRYGSTVCSVVAQHRQFASGVMSRRMEGPGAERARQMADAVLAGKRHPGVRDAMFFHTAGFKFHYPNMRYVLVAGGNAFYEKRSGDAPGQAQENAKSRALAIAYARIDPTGAAKPIMPTPGAPSSMQAPIQTAAVTTTGVPGGMPAQAAQPRVVSTGWPILAASMPQPAQAQPAQRAVQPNVAPTLVSSVPVPPSRPATPGAAPQPAGVTVVASANVPIPAPRPNLPAAAPQAQSALQQVAQIPMPEPRPAAASAPRTIQVSEPALASVTPVAPQRVQVASNETKPAPRVVQPTAPALASVAPVPAAATPEPSAEMITAPNRIAAAFAAFPSAHSTGVGLVTAYAGDYR